MALVGMFGMITPLKQSLRKTNSATNGAETRNVEMWESPGLNAERSALSPQPWTPRQFHQSLAPLMRISSVSMSRILLVNNNEQYLHAYMSRVQHLIDNSCTSLGQKVQIRTFATHGRYQQISNHVCYHIVIQAIIKFGNTFLDNCFLLIYIFIGD